MGGGEIALIGVDVGTSSCKGVLLNGGSVVRALAKSDYEMLHDSAGRSEIDARRVRDGVWRVIAELAAAASQIGDPVVALAFSVSGNEATALDRSGEPLAATIGAMDPRGERELAQWTQIVEPLSCYRTAGTPPHVMHPLMRFRWMRDNDPYVFERLERYLCWGDLLATWLGAEPGIDHSMASCTMAFDLRSRQWSQEILAAAGAPANVFGTPVRTGEVLGTVAPRVAAHLGLSASVEIVAGGFDQPMAALGAGCLSSGDSAISAGTWESLSVVTEQPVTTEVTLASGHVSGCYVAGDHYYSVANNPGGSSVVEWLIDTIGAAEAARALREGGVAADLLIRQATPTPTGIFVTPHHGGAYNPWMNPQATGSIHGLKLSTTRGDLIKAFLEGITYELRTNLQLMTSAGLEISNVVVTGGGSRSDVWMQLRADMLGIPLTRCEVAEPGCLAAACVAGVATGIFDDLEGPIRVHLGSTTVFEPREGVSAQYEELHPEYVSIAARTAARTAKAPGIETPHDTAPIRGDQG